MKRKLLIGAGVLLALMAVAVIALGVVVRTYLKSEKLKPIIIPRAEEFTGRDVELDRIDVSLFKGVVLKGLSVKEGEKDFVSVREFVLAYDLLPLLRKQLVIRKIVLVSPSVRIIRLSKGKFNFSDILEGAAEGEGAAEKDKPEDGGLPVSIVTEKVVVEDARVEFADAMKEIPDFTARADAELGISMEEKGLRAEGRVELKELSAELKGVKAAARGRLDISRDSLKADLVTSLDGEEISLEATARDYATAPAVKFALRAGALDLEKLMALAGDSGRGGAGKKGPGADARKSDEGNPLDVRAAGTVDIKSAKYREFAATDIHLAAESKLRAASALTGEINITELKASMNGANLDSDGTVKLDPDSIRAVLRTGIGVPGSFELGEYSVQKLELDASPDVVYLLDEERLEARIPVGRLTAAAVETKETSVNRLAFAGTAEATYRIKTESLGAALKIDEMNASVRGVDLSTKGVVSYDGKTLDVSLTDLRAAAETLPHEKHTVKDLNLSADTALALRLRDKAPLGGTLKLRELKANINGVNASLAGKISATEEKASTDLRATVEDDVIKLTATATRYREAPEINFNVSSAQLNLDRLMAMAGREKEAPGEKTREATRPKKATMEGEKPLEVSARGKVRIEKAFFRDYDISGFAADISYLDEVMTADPVTMALAGGTSMVVDGDFEGNVSFRYPRGAVDASEKMKRTMSGKGTSTFTKIQIKDVKVADAIARLTSVEELQNPTFTDSRFDYAIRDQKVNLDGYMNSRRIKFSTRGYVGLDKSLDMEADLWLDKLLARRLVVTRVIKGEDGSAILPLVIKGTTEQPKVNINAEKVLKKEIDKGLDKLFEKVLPRKEEEPRPAAPQEQPPAEEPPQEKQPEEQIKEIFKGIFGK